MLSDIGLNGIELGDATQYFIAKAAGAALCDFVELASNVDPSKPLPELSMTDTKR